MLTKTQLKNILSENDIRLRKSLGQNFLIDKNIKDKIIEKADIKENDFVLEIGPGLGALTEDLAKRAANVIAVEKDRKLCAILRDSLALYKNLKVIEADILDFNIEEKVKVIGNLPYYITSPIIFHLLEFKERINSILITVQKEVAERIAAKPGGKDYGVMSLSIAYYARPTVEMAIRRTAFFPQPEVDSSLVRLELRREPPVSVKNEELLFEIIRAAFGQRRKTLSNALKNSLKKRFPSESGKFEESVSNEVSAAIERAGIDGRRRGETLSLEEFASLANALMI